jgi:hypothetical protein
MRTHIQTYLQILQHFPENQIADEGDVCKWPRNFLPQDIDLGLHVKLLVYYIRRCLPL